MIGRWRRVWRRNRSLRIAALFSPVLAILGVCMLVPLAVMLLYSLWRVESFSLVREVSLANYAYILHTDIYLRLTAKALLYGLVVTVLTLLIGFPVAWFMARRATIRKNLIITAVLLPLYTSDLIRYFAWRTILGTEGFLNRVLTGIGLLSDPLEVLSFSPVAVVISLVHVYLPFMILAVWVSLEAIDPALIDAAMDLGAGPWRTLRSVVFPLALPGVVAGILFVFIPVTGEFFGVNMMGGTTGFTITNAINDQFASAFDWPLGSALSFVLLVSIGLVIAALLAGASRLAVVRNYLGREA